jgi:hypothetical protein
MKWLFSSTIHHENNTGLQIAENKINKIKTSRQKILKIFCLDIQNSVLLV